MSNILLTGSTGFLGKYIYDHLKDDYSIYTINRLSGNFICDLTIEVPKVNKYFDIVIHSAGLAHYDLKGKNEYENFLNSNINITSNLLSSLIFKPKAFIFISSVSVYGLEYGINVSENAPLLAKDPYGLSKIHSEKLIQDWCKLNNINCIILRLPLIVGRKPKGNLKKMIDAIKFGYFFQINFGKAKKSMVLAEDVANSILILSEYPGIYNLTDGYHPSVNEITYLYSKLLNRRNNLNISYKQARIIAKIGDLLGSFSLFNTKKLKKIVNDLTFDDSLARKTFNWSPRKVIDHISF